MGRLAVLTSLLAALASAAACDAFSSGADDGETETSDGGASDAASDSIEPDAEPPADLDPVVEVGAGIAHACALRRSGTVYCWGANGRAQLGQPIVDPPPAACGATPCNPVPTAVAGLPKIARLAVG